MLVLCSRPKLQKALPVCALSYFNLVILRPEDAVALQLEKLSHQKVWVYFLCHSPLCPVGCPSLSTGKCLPPDLHFSVSTHLFSIHEGDT